ncbi:protein NSP-INTERACTING KINASE [Trifolium repens]|nr:protein NSP-INTERACTING KINASE [Trifolium repens]
MPLNVLLLLLLFLFLSPQPLSSASLPRNPEVEALMSIKEALNDPNGVLSNWDEFSVDPCSWPIITCSSDYFVIALVAPSQNLSGTLSSAIGNLTNLKQVLLQNSNISGKIPPQLGNLHKLQTLDLSNNRFSGFIPSSLSQLNSLLQYLRLNNNRLSGPFPVTLAKITQLAFLDLSYNNLTGPLPKFPARSFFNIVGNPLICLSISIEGCSGSVTLMHVPFSQASSEDVNGPIDSISATLIRTAVDKPVHYECPGETFVEQPGSAHVIAGNSEADIVCHAAWNNLEGTFLARDKKYDRSHNFVYWSVRRDGFYHSWDDTNYEKKYGWNH